MLYNIKSLYLHRVFHGITSGLTIDTNIDDDKPQFCVCTKEYGYEYSGERVPGDFYNLNYKINENLIEHIMRYLYMTNKNLFNEILKYIL